VHRRIEDKEMNVVARLSPEVAIGRMPAPANDVGRKLNARARAVAESLSAQPVSPLLVRGFARLAELAITIGIGFAVHAIYVAETFALDWTYPLPILFGSLLAVVSVQASSGYSIGALRSGIGSVGRVLGAWTLVFALFAVAAFLFKSGDQYSRVWFVGWYAGGLIGLTAFRIAYAAAIRHWTRAGRLERRAVIVGGGASAEDLIRQIKAQPDNDIRICGIFDDRRDDRSPAKVAGYPKLGTIAELVEFGRLARIDLLIVSLPIRAENRLLEMLRQLWVLPVDIRLSAHTNKLQFRPRAYSYIGAVPLIDLVDKPIADWDHIAKRSFDLVIASLAIVALSPVMLATAIAIRLDSPGPIFFRQKRYGFNNEVIDVLKFRSMYHHMADPAAKKVVTRNDPRVTRVGRFIRKTSIDELPQLFNVLAGSLSLVGPRPHAVNAHTANQLFEQVVDGYFARHRVRPGVTGWAQINGWRGEIDSHEKIMGRVEADLHYIEKWSVLFDLYILAITPFRLLDTENAY
jgi:Undecaprenyl-phosphate glucose phosphotransferase